MNEMALFLYVLWIVCYSFTLREILVERGLSPFSGVLWLVSLLLVLGASFVQFNMWIILLGFIISILTNVDKLKP